MREIKFREKIAYKIDDWYITTDITKLRADSKGLVGRPCIEMQDRVGNRIVVKIKVRDFEV